jgi:hypothetical protein
MEIRALSLNWDFFLFFFVSGDLPSSLMEIGGLLLSLAGTVIHSQSTLCSNVTLYLIYNSTTLNQRCIHTTILCSRYILLDIIGS